MEVDEEELVKTVSGGQQFKRPTSSMPVSLSLLLREHVCHACWWWRLGPRPRYLRKHRGQGPQASRVGLGQESSFIVTFSLLSCSLGTMLSLADTWRGDSVVYKLLSL